METPDRSGAAGGPPRSGDRVRAITDDRDGEAVEGILHIRHVPSLGYAQVIVVAGVRAWFVAPDSIELLRPSVVPLPELEEGDPLVGEPGWRRVADLQQAADDGLLAPGHGREGGSWDDLFAQLELRVQPMLDAGWKLVSTDRDESWEYGDSVFYDLEREGTVIELEYYEHSQLVAYPISGAHPDDETEPFFSIANTTIESSHRALAEMDGSHLQDQATGRSLSDPRRCADGIAERPSDPSSHHGVAMPRLHPPIPVTPSGVPMAADLDVSVDPGDPLVVHRALGAVVGSAVADVLGAPFEFGPPGEYRRHFPEPVLGGTGELVGGFGWAPGQFTDDTEMAVATAEPLLACRGIDTAELFVRFQVWAAGARDVGVLTREVLGSGLPAREAATTVLDRRGGRNGAGNGSLMRAAPCAVHFAPRGRAANMAAGAALSAVTHADPLAQWAAALQHELVRLALGGADPLAAVPELLELQPPHLAPTRANHER